MQMKETVKKYRDTISTHLEAYENSVVKVMREYISKEYVSFFGPIKYDDTCADIPNWTAMAKARMCFLIDWLIRNQVIVYVYNTIGKRVKISTQDSDNAGWCIAPKDKLAKMLIYYFNTAVENSTQMWNEEACTFLHVDKDIHTWYHKLCCMKVKMDAGCYKRDEERAQGKWNRCENMIRLCYVIFGLFEETRAYMNDIDKYLDGKPVKLDKYKMNRELLFVYRDARKAYLESDEELNYVSKYDTKMTEEEKYKLEYIEDDV